MTRHRDEERSSRASSLEAIPTPEGRRRGAASPALPALPPEALPEVDSGRALLAFRPLARSLARRYMGRGAEFEDLEQEACLAMLDLIPRCPEGVPLALHLIRQLPGRVRRSAERLRRQSLGGALFGPDLDDLAEVLPCPRESRIAQAVEAADLLERLAPEERALALRLAAGDSQGEIARDRGVTQQAVSARIRRLRARVAAALRED